MREMFGGIVEPSSFRVGPRRRRTPQITFAVVCATVLLLGSVEVGQIMATVDLPLTPRQLIAFLPAVPVADVQLPAPSRATPRRLQGPASPIGAPATPLAAPEGIAPEKPGTLSRPSMPGEILGGGGLAPGTFAMEIVEPPAPPKPAPPPGAPKEIPRVGGNLKPPMRTNSVQLRYPPMAIAARVEGVVIIEATINIEGKVVASRILRSVPMLDAAALATVSQWEFTPSILNGQPTPVIMTITVNFTLQ